MGINMYVINAILVLMVIGQVGEHPLDLRFLAVPVLAVGAAVLFLRSAPVGSDIMLEAACVAPGAVVGAIGGLAPHRLRVGAGSWPLSRAGAWRPAYGSAAGARLAFAVAAGNGAGPAIARFPSRTTSPVRPPGWRRW